MPSSKKVGQLTVANMGWVGITGKLNRAILELTSTRISFGAGQKAMGDESLFLALNIYGNFKIIK